MPNHLTLAAMAAQIRENRLAPTELVDAHLRHIKKHNPDLNAFVSLLSTEARQIAAAREQEAIGGEVKGLLHGVPVTVKDSFDMAGLPTVCGTRLRERHVARSDSTAARRLREAGAVILGKTNCPEFLMCYETDNYITGQTNNPWNLEMTPGGSSGGESAAISSFCSAGGIGSDGGGSIREPAHLCGIAGLKPTPGRVPATGHYPEIAHPGGLLGVGGPMARSVQDVRILFEVLAGHDPLDPFSAPVPVREISSKGIRIGVMEQVGEVPVEPAVRQAVRKAAGLLADAGFVVEAFAPAIAGRAAELWAFFFKRLPATVMKDIIESAADELHWSGTELFYQVMDEPEPSGKEVLERLVTRDKLRGNLLRQMEEYPVLLWPGCGIASFRHRQREWQTPERPISYNEAMMPLTPANALGLPALAVPVSLSSDGLPLGVQLIGRPWEEELLLEIGEKLEAARGAFPSPPGY